MSNATDDSQAIHRTQLELRKERADHHVRLVTIGVLAFLVALNLTVVVLQVWRSGTNSRTLELIEEATGPESRERQASSTQDILEVIDCKGRVRLQIALDRLQQILGRLVADGVIDPAAAGAIGPPPDVLCEPASTPEGD